MVLCFCFRASDSVAVFCATNLQQLRPLTPTSMMRCFYMRLVVTNCIVAMVFSVGCNVFF